MNSEPASSNGATRLRLDGELTIYRAAELKQTLLKALEQAPHLELDLAGVSELDSAGVQILILAKLHAEAMQHTLRLTGHSTAVLAVLEELNLAAFFGDQLVIQSQSSTTHA
jgi:anti-sigma B factor antagonist